VPAFIGLPVQTGQVMTNEFEGMKIMLISLVRTLVGANINKGQFVIKEYIFVATIKETN